MTDQERVLGRLEEFRDWAKEEFENVNRKIDALNEFKWRVAGGAAVLGVIMGAVGSVVVELLRH